MQIYKDGALTTFGNSFGGYGLMSATMDEDMLFYTYSWGSGIHRSHVGALSIMGDQIQILETVGFVNEDLFVRNMGGQSIIEVGDYLGFNSWEKSGVLGQPKLLNGSLSIIDHEGNDKVSNIGG